MLNKIAKKIRNSLRAMQCYSTTIIKECPVITVKQGKLQGTEEKLYDGSSYYSFKGIPYAQPPIGELRFKAPVPPEQWNGVYDAREHGQICPQTNLLTRSLVPGNENCLFLNVYTKSLLPSSKQPVIVYIHYGAFRWGAGDSDLQGPEYLLQHDVILVTFNYRLEVFGFLCLDTPQVPGNAGMKDQVAVLRWVQDNIEQFGGDRDNVTIMGISSGAASVTHHMLSPMSQDLFHKAIAHSGNSFMTAAVGCDSRERAFKVGKVLGKETSDPNELLRFLQSVPSIVLADKLNYKTATLEEKKRDYPVYFVPVVEKKFHNVEPFLEEHPYDLMNKNKIKKVPFISGYNSSEGLISISSMQKSLKYINDFPYCLIPRDIARRVSRSKLDEMGKRVKQFYCGDENFNEDDVQLLNDLQTDVRFSYDIHRFTNLYANICKDTYFYRFDYESEVQIIKKAFGWNEIKGVAHGDDLYFFFTNVGAQHIYEKHKEELNKKMNKLTKIWTDFVKTGDPTPDDSAGVKWSPFSPVRGECLHIREDLRMGPVPERDRIAFWDQLHQEGGNQIKSNQNHLFKIV